MEHTIYNNDVQEYRTGPVKFGICMATYQRKSGKTPGYLRRSLDALVNQTATNWHLYLVGDKYTNHSEFLDIISSFPKDKITAVNLDSAPERENITNILNLWKVGGCNAFNHSHKLALEDGCDYILHHDDDDFFHPKKIQIINYVLSQHSNPMCVFHYSTYISSGILPCEKINQIYPNNLQPRECNVIHSSLCIHKSIISVFRYDGFRPNKIEYICGDVQLLRFIGNIISSDHNKYNIFIPLILNNHDIEGEVMRCN